MNSFDSEQIKLLFEAAYELEPIARIRFLAEACGSDLAMRSHVEGLLLAYDESARFLESQDLFDAAPNANASAAIGRRIGSYQVIRELGRGGMGVVYLAHRADQAFEKKVAIKLVWPGIGGEAVIQRFLQETKILARLDHPNIARLLDAGQTDDGWHFIVMEYVEGCTIAEYTVQKRLPINRLLALFQQVCDAVHYAHQNLVIHRDIKPSNILVTADGVPKLLDFGIAKFLEPTDTSVALTHTQMPLTPEYASPEQLSGQQITTVTDIYSLGVVLYEILTRRKPYQFKALALHEISRVITEHPPEKTYLPDELEKIVLMALRKEPKHRYQTIEQFSEDIRRYLNGEPILARKATWHYHAQKFIKRNKALVALSTTLIVFLITGALFASQQALRAKQQAREQRRQLYASQMSQALEDWETGNVKRMRATLDRWVANSDEEELRGFEWNHLWHLAHPDAIALSPHPIKDDFSYGFYDYDHYISGITENAVKLFDSQNGQLINSIDLAGYQQMDMARNEKYFPLFLSTPQAITISNLKTGALLRQIHESYLNIRLVGASDNKFATAQQDGTLKRWSLDDGKLIDAIQCQEEPILAFRFSDNEDVLLTRVTATQWQLLDLKTRQRRRFAVDASAKGPIFSSDSKYFYFYASNLGVSVYAADSGRKLKQITTPNHILLDVFITSDSKHLVLTSSDNTAKMYRLPNLEQVAVFTSESWMPTAFVTPDGKYFGAVCNDQVIRIWEIANQQLIAVEKSHTAKIFGAQLSHDGKKLLSWGGDNVAHIRALSAILQPNTFKGHDGYVFAIAFSPDGKLLASASSDQTVKIWDVKTGACLKTLNEPHNWVFAVAFAPDGKTLATGDRDKLIHLWDLTTGTKIRQFSGHTDPVRSLSFTPDGSKIVSGSSDQTVRVWDVASGRELNTIKAHTNEVYSVQVSPSGKQILSASYDRAAHIWDLATGQKIGSLQGHQGAVWKAAFAPDGNTIATGSSDQIIRIWDAKTGRELNQFSGHGSDIFSLAWSPDGKRIASASNDKTVRIWNVQYGFELLKLRAHTKQVWSVAFAPDGNTLASSSWDGTIHTWRTQ